MNRQKIHIHLVCLIALASLAAAVPLSARAESGGDVLCVQGMQDDAVVLAGTARGGIYRSTDGGSTWMQTGLRTGCVRTIAADPRNASHYYAGTSLGVYASTDSGCSWWAIDQSMQISALAVSLTSPRIVLSSDGSVVRRTADDGKQWSAIAPLASYGITMLAGTRSDTGQTFFAACDSLVFMSVEKNQAVWTRLPALPPTGGEPVHITAVAADTLSRDGMSLIVGTSGGVYIYSFARGIWRHPSSGLPSGSVTSLGLIVYDTTAASRSYSLCASVAADPSNTLSTGGVYKISSVSGVIDTPSVWNLIAGDQPAVRATFAPESGANRGKIYLATADGLRISYDGGTTWTRKELAAYPIAALSASSYNAGIVKTRGLERITVPVVNSGDGELKLRVRIDGGDGNFMLQAVDTLAIAAGDTCMIPIQFNPIGQGKYSAELRIETNDPLASSVSLPLEGFCAGNGMQGKFAVLDRTHGGVWHARYAQLAQALALAGMSVIDTLPSGDQTDCAMIILPGPETEFTESECSVIAKCAESGTSVAALCGGSGKSLAVLNALFRSKAWRKDVRDTIGLPFRFRSTRVTAPAGGFDASKSFGLRSASFLGNAETFRFTSAYELASTGADTLCTARGVTCTDSVAGVRTDADAMVGGVACTGNGKVIVLGDAGFWASDTADAGAGLWSADNFSAALSIAATIGKGDVGLKTKTANEQYSLISVPYPPADNAIGSIFKDLGQPDPMKWRLFGEWNGQTLAYAEYPSPLVMTIDRGKGYWLITKGEQEIGSDSADYSLNPEPFAITLKPGFTLIGDPFVKEVDWNECTAGSGIDPVLWTYNGKEFVSSTIMTPFIGYFAYNAADTAVLVHVNPTWKTAAAGAKFGSSMAAFAAMNIRRSVQQSEGEWSVNVTATDGTVSDRENFCGMLRSAADTRDANDVAEPPDPPGRYVAFRFMRSGGAALAADFKAVHAEGAVWDCDVRASEQGASVTVQLAPETPLPEGCGIYLLDPVAERVVDCSAGAGCEIRFARDERTRALRIIAGSKNFVEQHTDGVPLTPLSYALEQNYPNPWNPSTTIRFALAHSGETRLEIFNLLGQKVRTLVNGALPIGIYARQWDGRDEAGVQAATGVYIYRLTTPSFTQSRRMVLLR